MSDSPLVRFPDATIELPLQYFGSIGHYALMSAFGHVVIDDTARFDKRFKSAHRCVIADTRGPLQLTVPVRKTTGPGAHTPLRWSDIAISDHGQWWQDIDVSLASAYGRTPFYEFYIDRLRRFFDRHTPEAFASVAELDIASDAAIRAILGLTNNLTYKSSSEGFPCVREPQNASTAVSSEPQLPQHAHPDAQLPSPEHISGAYSRASQRNADAHPFAAERNDCALPPAPQLINARLSGTPFDSECNDCALPLAPQCIDARLSGTPFDSECNACAQPLAPQQHRYYSAKELISKLTQIEYYQVRRDRLGFLPSLSILDLIYNLGPESPLLLRAMTASLRVESC